MGRARNVAPQLRRTRSPAGARERQPHRGGARALIRILFALEGRWTPLDHWLERELATLEDRARAGDLVLEALRNGRPEPLIEALDRLEEPLAAEGVARPAGRIALFLELIHPSRTEERARHGLS